MPLVGRTLIMPNKVTNIHNMMLFGNGMPVGGRCRISALERLEVIDARDPVGDFPRVMNGRTWQHSVGQQCEGGASALCGDIKQRGIWKMAEAPLNSNPSAALN